jgi:hypothetical protein
MTPIVAALLTPVPGLGGMLGSYLLPVLILVGIVCYLIGKGNKG